MTELIPSRSWSVVFIAVALWAGSAQGTPVRLVTFGPEASPGKGDDDFTEEIYLRIPPGAPSPLYVRIFDPDIGGAEDEPNGLWNTRTRFAVYGGEGAGRRSTPDAGTRGSLLAEAVFGEDAAADGRAAGRPSQRSIRTKATPLLMATCSGCGSRASPATTATSMTWR